MAYKLQDFEKGLANLKAAGMYPIRGGAEEPTVAELQTKLGEMDTKLTEFRDNNVKLSAALEKFGDITPEDAAEAADLKRQRERKELVDSKDIDAALDVQEKKLSDDFTRRNEAMQAELDTTKNLLREVSVTNVLKTEAIEAGVRPEAIDDVVGAIQAQFESKDGRLVHMVDGKPVLSEKNAGADEAPGEFFEKYALAKPFYFDGSGGGGGEETRRKAGGGRTITQAEFETGDFNEAVRKGDVQVEGFEKAA